MILTEQEINTVEDVIQQVTQKVEAEPDIFTREMPKTPKLDLAVWNNIKNNKSLDWYSENYFWRMLQDGFNCIVNDEKRSYEAEQDEGKEDVPLLEKIKFHEKQLEEIREIINKYNEENDTEVEEKEEVVVNTPEKKVVKKVKTIKKVVKKTSDATTENNKQENEQKIENKPEMGEVIESKVELPPEEAKKEEETKETKEETTIINKKTTIINEDTEIINKGNKKKKEEKKPKKKKKIQTKKKPVAKKKKKTQPKPVVKEPEPKPIPPVHKKTGKKKNLSLVEVKIREKQSRKLKKVKRLRDHIIVVNEDFTEVKYWSPEDLMLALDKKRKLIYNKDSVACDKPRGLEINPITGRVFDFEKESIKEMKKQRRKNLSLKIKEEKKKEREEEKAKEAEKKLKEKETNKKEGK